MANSDPKTLNNEQVERVLNFVLSEIYHHFIRPVTNLPMPEDAIRMALIAGGGYIQMVEGGNVFLVVTTDRNGMLRVYEGTTRGFIGLSINGVEKTSEDALKVDALREIYISDDGLGLLVYQRTFENTRSDVTILRLKPIDVQTFIRGLKARAHALAI